ncbi:unnamed protein product, partial [Mycena citricolor]
NVSIVPLRICHFQMTFHLDPHAPPDTYPGIYQDALNRWIRWEGTPRFQSQAYGPINGFLQIKFGNEHFFVKPQKGLRAPIPGADSYDDDDDVAFAEEDEAEDDSSDSTGSTDSSYVSGSRNSSDSSGSENNEMRAESVILRPRVQPPQAMDLDEGDGHGSKDINRRSRSNSNRSIDSNHNEGMSLASQKGTRFPDFTVEKVFRDGPDGQIFPHRIALLVELGSRATLERMIAAGGPKARRRFYESMLRQLRQYLWRAWGQSTFTQPILGMAMVGNQVYFIKIKDQVFQPVFKVDRHDEWPSMFEQRSRFIELLDAVKMEYMNLPTPQ